MSATPDNCHTAAVATTAHPSLSAKSSPAASPALVVFILSLLLGLQPVTTDLYLPALPALTEGFAASLSQAQLTLSALLLAFGVSQLIWGPLSDRFGRRPILLWGLGAYVLASVLSTLSTSMNGLILARAVQGAAMGAAVMCARAIVRDLYHPRDGARVMSKSLTGLGVIACCSAPLGGLLTAQLGWRAALLSLTVFGALTLLVVAFCFQETLTKKNPQALQLRSLGTTWRQILGHPTFWAFSTLSVASYGGLFTFLASSSFVFIKVLHLALPAYGGVMFGVSFTYILGTFACRRMLPRLGIQRALAIAGGFSLSGGVLMLVLALLGLHESWAIMLPFYVYMLAHGVHQPCSQSGAVGPFPYAAGAASALNGFLMMLAAFGVGAWLSTHLDNTVMPLVWGIFFWSVLIALSTWTLIQKHGQPKDH
jgi:DHA1 family bicyclomycin/chloramphenicol resistance-like MFS transporter